MEKEPHNKITLQWNDYNNVLKQVSELSPSHGKMELNRSLSREGGHTKTFHLQRHCFPMHTSLAMHYTAAQEL